MTDFALQASHLSKHYDDGVTRIDVLVDVSIAIARGEMVAVVGASGSGKSTLLAIMAGLDTPTQGTVHLAGQDIFSLDEDERAALRASTIGFVFQSFQLLAPLTALENVMLPLELAGHPDPKPVAKDMLSRVGLAERLNHYPKVMSGGEQQRVALARAFVVKPKLLLADEPTGSLDHATGETIMQLMLELNRELGTTLVLVTHDVALSRRCDQRLVMEAGRARWLE